MMFLNENMDDVLLTLENKKMYIETILRELVNDKEFLCQYSIQDEGGLEVKESEHWIDKKHLEYWDECIDPSYKPIDVKPEVVMIPNNTRKKMD